MVATDVASRGIGMIADPDIPLNFLSSLPPFIAMRELPLCSA